MRHDATRLARCARRLGVGRNPLRRRTDRIEAVVLLVTAILLVVAAPISAVAAGLQAGHLALSHARAEVFGLHSAGRTRVIYETRPLAGVNDAISEVLHGKAKGRLVLEP